MTREIEPKVTAYWVEHAESVLLNRKIVEVRYLNDDEMEMLGWYKRPIAFVLDDDTLCYLSCDDEGNDGGVMFYQKENDEGGGTIPVL